MRSRLVSIFIHSFFIKVEEADEEVDEVAPPPTGMAAEMEAAERTGRLAVLLLED